MKLQDRNLNIRMRGKDVELLRQELRQLGFTIEDEAGYFGSSTRQVVEQFQEENNLEMTGMVDEPTAALINEAVQALESEPEGDDAVSSFVVRGHVREADGNPLIEAIVRAFDKDLRHEEHLGEEVSDESGSYEIVYTAAQFRRAEKQNADLVVRVFNQEDQELIASDILFNAQTEETVNLMIGGGEYRGPSEYEQLLAEITPVLENVSLTELRKEDISFLSSETGLVSQHIEFLALASKRAQETDLPAEIFYGFARQDLPTSLSALLEQDHQVLRQALETALTENIIPQRLESSLEEIIAQLQQLIIDQEVKGETSRGALVKTSPFLMDQQRKVFAGAYAQHEGSIEDFWEELGKLPEFSEEGSVEELQLTLQMGEFTQSHLPMVENLQERRQVGTLQSLRDLAKWDLDQWRVLIKIVGAPPDVPGNDENERVENYAEIMFETVENDYASAVVTHRLSLEEEAIPGADVLYQFLDQNPEFDLGTTDIDSYLGADVDNELVTQLKSWQRIHRISPMHGRYDAMRELKKDGLDSSQAVTRRGPSAFVRDYSGKLGSEEKAQEVWNKASHTAAMALAVFAGYSTAFNNVMPKFIPSPVVTENDGIPNWKELFGSLDFCECEHCKSVHGPAAYFTDLLYFLKEPSNKNALTVLLSRRPDLEKIELSCENTNTVLPYVDLVNEVLEEAVAPGTTSLKLRQTSGKADELSATPEHLNEEAYFKLANAVYPWDLPFDLWFEEAQIYQKHLGLKRYLWMEKLWKEELMKLPPTSKAQKIALDVACDHLGITTLERKFITNDLNQPEETLWGFQQPKDLENELRKVQVFLKKVGYDENESGKNFKELRKLLIGTQFLNENDTIQILFKKEPCDLDEAGIENDQDAPPERRRPEWELILNKARRFLRLQRKLGWTIPELDKTITAFNTDLDKDFLQHLSRIERLRDKLSVPLLEILSWWGNIDTAEDRTEKEKSKKTPSLYEQLFLNKAVNNPVNPVFKLNTERTELEKPYNPLTPDNIAYVAAALESKTADLLLLIDIDKKNKKEVPNQLNLKHLSHLYRILSLTKALNLTVKEFLSAKAFTGVDPFKDYNNDLTPLQSFKFVEKIQTIQTSGFSIIELDYLLRHKYEDKDNIAPTDAEIAKALSEIHSGLKKIEEENTLAPDPQGDLTRKKLALLLSEDKVPEIFEVISGDSEKKLGEQKKLIDKLLSPYLDANDAKSQLIKPNPTTPAPLNTKPERFAYVLKPLLIYLRTTLSQNLIKQKISTALSLDADTTALLLETLVNAQIDKKKPAQKDFLALSTGGLSAAYYPNNAFAGKPVEQIDSTINFEWTAQNPPPGAPNAFSVRWSGMVQAEKSGTYTFHVQADRDVRLRVNNQLIVDAWTNQQGPVDAKGTIVLETGKFYPIKMEYRTNNATGKAKLQWKSPSASEQVISSRNLVPTIIISSYRLLHKLSLLITNFKIQADELRYLSENGTDFESFDLNAFLTDTSGATVNLFKQWVRLNQVFTFRDRYPRLETRLIDVFGATANQKDSKKSIEEAKKQLIALTVWDKKELDVLTGDEGFKLTAGDFRKGNKFSELYEAFKLINQLGISAEQLVKWIATDLGSSFGNLNDANFKNKKSIVLTLKQTVKAKYGQKQWLQIAKPLRNELRKNQRDALTSYLVHYYKLKNANQLYGKFLIDVEMDPCMMTSRIKQAISTVQLFVQRCLMNLETEVSLSPAEAREWKWRKNYRVWEANRKVFLYPENWIEPELRDDKSPFFEDLENELLQNEITKDTAEMAFLKYLEKLNDVARLEIVGMYVQDKEHKNDTKKLHVFGRTHGTPHIYYYRQWIDESYWTAWERVDLDIEGDHLIPVVWNRRLYLFWPIFKEEVDRKQKFKKDQEV
ncbi:Peptidoglycan-binding (PGRP) domain of peptidoglycan hydrolases-containing protein, partial [Candidatus Methanophagaceae archaeon]